MKSPGLKARGQVALLVVVLSQPASVPRQRERERPLTQDSESRAARSSSAFPPSPHPRLGGLRGKGWGTPSRGTRGRIGVRLLQYDLPYS
jgi:hypothetical protein